MTAAEVRCTSCGRYYPPEKMHRKKIGAGNGWRWRCAGCADRVRQLKTQSQLERAEK